MARWLSRIAARPKAALRWDAALGAVVWLAASPWIVGDLAAVILLLGALAVVPLGLALVVDETPNGRAARRNLVTVLAQPPTALCLLAAFTLRPGPAAAALAAPWLLFTLWVAFLGALRLRATGFRRAEEVSVAAGLVFLAVGGAWTAASRYGLDLTPLGFSDVIVLLTGAHFHYAGFALPILTGFAGRRLPGWTARLAAAGVVLGVPLVAFGLTLGDRAPLVRLAAAWELAAACLLVALLHVRLAFTPQPVGRPLLFLASGLFLAAGMGLAAAYELGQFLQTHWLSIEWMIPWHGLMNSLGFALPGLAAWHLSEDGMQVVWRCLGQAPRLDALAGRPFPLGVERGPRPGDRRDSYERVVAHETPGAPAADGPFRRLARAVLAYEVFPPSLVTGVLPRAPLQPGDTYGICYHFLPGVDLLFGGRVTAAFDGPAGDGWRAGFTFRTLRGHPAVGEETFSVEKDAAGAVTVGLRSWSRPGLWLTRLLRPWMRWMQVRACHAALDNLQRTAAEAEAVHIPG
jgi:hypothetical protein